MFDHRVNVDHFTWAHADSDTQHRLISLLPPKLHEVLVTWALNADDAPSACRFSTYEENLMDARTALEGFASLGWGSMGIADFLCLDPAEQAAVRAYSGGSPELGTHFPTARKLQALLQHGVCRGALLVLAAVAHGILTYRPFERSVQKEPYIITVMRQDLQRIHRLMPAAVMELLVNHAIEYVARERCSELTFRGAKDMVFDSTTNDRLKLIQSDPGVPLLPPERELLLAYLTLFAAPYMGHIEPIYQWRNAYEERKKT